LFKSHRNSEHWTQLKIMTSQFDLYTQTCHSLTLQYAKNSIWEGYEPTIFQYECLHSKRRHLAVDSSCQQFCLYSNYFFYFSEIKVEEESEQFLSPNSSNVDSSHEVCQIAIGTHPPQNLRVIQSVPGNVTNLTSYVVLVKGSILENLT